MKKLLTVAMLAALTVGASAQTRHYATGNSVVTALPGGDKVETRMVEVVPVTVIRSSEAPVFYTMPSSYSMPTPGSETRVLQVRQYDDTADVSEELYVPRSDLYDVMYETKSSTTIIER